MGYGNQYRKQEKILGVGLVSRLVGTIFQAVEKRDKRAIASPEQVVAIRLGERDLRYRPFTDEGVLTSTGIIYLPGIKGAIIADPSPLIDNYRELRRIHESIMGGSPLYMNPETARAMILNSAPIIESTEPMETKQLDKDERAKILFGKNAGEYGEYLESRGIPLVPFRFPSKQDIDSAKAPFLVQLKLSAIDQYGQSAIDGSFPLRGRASIAGIIGDVRVTRNESYTGVNGRKYTTPDEERTPRNIEHEDPKRIEKRNYEIGRIIRERLSEARHGQFEIDIPDGIKLKRGEEVDLTINGKEICATAFSKGGKMRLRVIADLEQATAKVRAERVRAERKYSLAG